MNKLNDFLRVSDAAEYLGVSPNTLRNWENAGKIIAHRHPVNGYRLFKQKDLDDLLSAAHVRSVGKSQGSSGDAADPPQKPR